MCGVIGYVGRRHAREHLLRGLESLEYRGYDSAGICLLSGGSLDSVRAVGKLENLKVKINGQGAGATIGIGHTRWATHGRVTEANAHPLTSGNGHGDEVAIVLNGIIENHGALREELAAEGQVFHSETDAEVVAHLVRRHYDHDLTEAVRCASQRLQGHFAFVALHRDEPDVLVGTRHECPLLVGVGEDEAFLASSVTAFAGATRCVKLVEDGEVVTVSPDRVRVVTADGEERTRDDVVVVTDVGAPNRAGYETFMLKEIHEQPRAVRETVARNLADCALDLGPARDKDLARIRRLVILGCGTAYHAGLVGRYAIERWAGVPCDPEIASEWRYRGPLMDTDTLVVGISQFGETADTLAGLRLARAKGARTLAITNTPGSQITREVDAVLHTYAGMEMGVAATKTFTAQVALMYLLALRLARARGTLDYEAIERLTGAVRALPHAIEQCLAARQDVEPIAARHQGKPFFLYLGRDVGLPVCLEGALKLKEVSYIPTEAYASGEMKHGPIALLDEQTPVVCVANDGHVYDKLVSNLEEIRARGAQIIAIVTEGDRRIARLADHVMSVPRTEPLLQPALAVIPLQLLAYRIARLRGLDVDQPRNLAKTVTVE
jgi:glucosamine--fructose-6-phosphate aminotransferase (isomerizing)